MNKAVVGIIIAIVALAGIGGVLALNSSGDSDRQATDTHSGQSTDHMDDTNMSGAQNEASRQTSRSMETQATDKVDISDFEFMPKKITVKKGTTVTWTNQDSARHNAYSDDENGPKGELLSKGESFSFTFNTVGSFDIYCEPHPYMKQVVEVTE